MFEVPSDELHRCRYRYRR